MVDNQMERQTEIRAFESQNPAIILCKSKIPVFLTDLLTFRLFSWVSSSAIMHSRIVSLFNVYVIHTYG